MEVGLIYSKKDPQQLKTRNHLVSYIKQHGILARLTEKDSEVPAPQIIIDGQKITDRRAKPRKGQIKSYPTLRDITQILEHKIWSL